VAAEASGRPAPADENRLYLSDLLDGDFARQFFVEANGLLDCAEAAALGLEDSAVPSDAAVHALFRSVHSLKSNAAFFRYAALERACAKLEAALDLVRRGEAPADAAFAALALAGLDAMRRLLAGAEVVDPADATRNDGPAAAGFDASRTEVRVDRRLLDRLIACAESFSPGRDGDSAAAAAEIRDLARALRREPLEALFYRLARLARDLSRQFGKPVDFRFAGGDIAVDRSAVELLTDPLIQLLRNALDHGLEATAAERRAAGKAARGQLTLEAREEGAEYSLRLADDGVGLDTGLIRARAVELGLLPADAPPLAPAALWRYIFEPGFSTCPPEPAAASGCEDARSAGRSGRGVGLDVVKRNLERLDGRVEVWSENGRGTEFVLRWPR
jgi:two-component system chemotaxis sensor kinase CheA